MDTMTRAPQTGPDEQRSQPDEQDSLGVGARALNLGASALLTGVIMVGASLLLWVGVPVGWLWIGSQIQGSTGSVGTAILVMLGGSVISVIAIAWVLARLNRVHQHLRAARGAEVTGPPLLEVVLVVTALVALAGFALWFFVFAGPGPSIAPRN